MTGNWLYFDVAGSIMVDIHTNELTLASGSGSEPSPVQVGISANNENLEFGAAGRLAFEQTGGGPAGVLHLNLDLGRVQ